jgi:hypothetical protein
LWSKEDRETIATIVASICQDATGALLDVELVSQRGRTAACEFLLLPLRHGPSSRDRILGSCAPHRRPYWFGTDAIVSQQITASKLLWPDEHSRGLGAERSRFVALPPAFFRSGGGRRHGHLYVVDGGKS